MTRTPTILIAEDEALLRLVAVEALRDAGYNVLEAGDGNEGLAVLGTKEQIDAPGGSQQGEALIAVARLEHVVAGIVQRLDGHKAQQRLVFRYQDRRCARHAASLPFSSASRAIRMTIVVPWPGALSI